MGSLLILGVFIALDALVTSLVICDVTICDNFTVVLTNIVIVVEQLIVQRSNLLVVVHVHLDVQILLVHITPSMVVIATVASVVTLVLVAIHVVHVLVSDTANVTHRVHADSHDSHVEAYTSITSS